MTGLRWHCDTAAILEMAVKCLETGDAWASLVRLPDSLPFPKDVLGVIPISEAMVRAPDLPNFSCVGVWVVRRVCCRAGTPTAHARAVETRSERTAPAAVREGLFDCLCVPRSPWQASVWQAFGFHCI